MCCFLVFFFIFPYGVPGQVWYLIVSIPDICLLLPILKDLLPLILTFIMDGLQYRECEL